MGSEQNPFLRSKKGLAEREKGIRKEMTEVGYRFKEYETFRKAFLQPISKQFLKQYAQNPLTFNASRFRIQPRLAKMNEELTGRLVPDWTYDKKSGWSDLEGHVFLDAPFGYTLEYKTKDDKWEIISTIAFRPDFDRHLLLIDQLQGGSTSRRTTTHEGRKARFKITAPDPMRYMSPEHALYAVALALAKSQNMTYVGLRKSEHSKYPDVSRRGEESRRIESSSTTYKIVSNTRAHRNIPFTAYTFEKIETNS